MSNSRYSPSDDLIRNALKRGPRISRYIQNVLVHGHDVAPSTVTGRLAYLCKKEAIFRRGFAYNGSDQHEAYVFALRKLTETDVVKAQKAIEFRDQVLNTQQLGEVGQDYVYGLLCRLEGIEVPRKHDLGKYIGKDGKLKIDIIVKHDYLSQFIGPLLFEVKNEIQTFHPSSQKIFKLVKDAVAEGAVPFFVAPHMTRESIIACRALGVRTLHLRRQLVPKTYLDLKSNKKRQTKPQVKRLRATMLGPAPYEFVAERFYQDGITLEANRDLVALQSEIDSKVTITHWEENWVEIKRMIDRNASWSEILTIPCERHWQRAAQITE